MKKTLLTLALAAVSMCANAETYSGTISLELGTNEITEATTVTIEDGAESSTVTIGSFDTEIMGMNVTVGPIVYSNVTKTDGDYSGELLDAKIASIPRFGAIKLVEVNLGIMVTESGMLLMSEGDCTIGGAKNDAFIMFQGTLESAAIGEVGADSDAPVEFFNLQGVRVNSENLPSGIYIRRQGAKSTKVLVK